MTKITERNGKDSVHFSWRIKLNEKDSSVPKKYAQLYIRIPIMEEANKKTLLGWDGKRILSDKCSLYLNHSAFVGTANIYFIRVSMRSDTDHINIAGLFNGNVGDSIFITKGRFDYTVELSGF